MAAPSCTRSGSTQNLMHEGAVHEHADASVSDSRQSPASVRSRAGSIRSISSMRSINVANAMEMWMMLRQKSQNASRNITPPAMRLMNNWNVEMYYRSRKGQGVLTLRDRIYRFLASPVSSPYSQYFSFAILVISMASVITFGVSRRCPTANVLPGRHASCSWLWRSSFARLLSGLLLRD